MKRTTELLICAILVGSASITKVIGQEANYNLALKSGVIFDAGVQDNPEAGLEATASEKPFGSCLRIIQFHEFPSKAGREELARVGILLLEYLPRKAYLASVSTTLDVSSVARFGIRRVLPVQPEIKLHPWLLAGNYPEWATTAAGDIDLVVKFNSQIKRSVVIAAMNMIGVQVLDGYPNTISILVRVPINKIITLADLPVVQYVEPIAPPAEPEDFLGKSLHRNNLVTGNYGTANRNYDGTGVSVAVNDDGYVGPHIDFTGRTQQADVATDFTGDHGDMVAGIVGGAGNRRPSAEGMAPGAFMHIRSYNSGLPNTEDLHRDSSVMIFSTSYSNGCNAGYTTVAQLVDTEIRNNPTLIQVFSAGNNNNVTDCGYGAGSQWGNITGGHKVGKNVIATGNLTASDVLVSSSSRGPAHDGRLKPEICANGNGQISCDPNHGYSAGSGTSAAAPGIAGVLATLYHAYRDLNGGDDPHSALMKATLLNTAHDLGNPGPDYNFGYGRVNAYRALKTLEDNNYLLDSVAQGVTNTHNIVVPVGTTQLRLMLGWTDYEGSLLATKALVNNLDLEVDDPSPTTFLPWVLDPTPVPANLNANAARGVDTLNNGEQVTIDAPLAGLYTIRVTGTEVPFGPQHYYIVYEFIEDEIMVTYPVGKENLVPGESTRIRWDAPPTAGPFSVLYSDNGGASWSVLSAAVAATAREYSWSVPAAPTGQGLVIVSDATLADTSDAVFSIIGTPTNLSVDFTCPDSIGLSWSAVSGATSYEISMLGPLYMDSIETTTATSFPLLGFDPMEDQWFSVKARGPAGIVGRRADAVYKASGVSNCYNLPVDVSLDEIVTPVFGAFSSCMYDTTIDVTIKFSNPGVAVLTNIPLYYQLNNDPIVSEIYPGPLGSGASTTYTFADRIFGDLEVPGSNSLVIWAGVPADDNHYNDTLSGFLGVFAGTTIAPPWEEDLESFTDCSTSGNCGNTNCNLQDGWINPVNYEYDDIDWRVNSGTTPTTNTGPIGDAKPGTANGNYLYLESSSCFGKNAYLLTPCLDLNGIINPTLEFSYHMHGNTMGNIFFDAYVDGAWVINIAGAIIGDHGTLWHNASLDLSNWINKTIVVRFRGETGSSYNSDMCLDNFRLNAVDPTGITETESKTGSISVFPNPASTQLNIRMNGGQETDLTIRMIDTRGALIVLWSEHNMKANQTISLPLENVASGLYYVQLQDAFGTTFQQIVSVIRTE